MVPRKTIIARGGWLLALWSAIASDRWGAAKASSSSSWVGGGAPWQAGEDSRSVLEESQYRERPPTTFSPTGRLHPVEQIAQQVQEPTSNLVLALKCHDGILLFSTVPTSPFLNTTTTSTLFCFGDESNDDDAERTTTTPIVALSPGLVGATAGHPLEGRVLRNKMHAFADQFLEDQEEEEDEKATNDDDHDRLRPASELARMLADHLQVPTQNMQARGGPMLASVAVLVGNDQIWRIDPTGQFWKCHAVVAGRDSGKVEEALCAKVLECRDQRNAGGTGLGEFLAASVSCEEALELVSALLPDLLWPPALLQRIPPELRSTSLPRLFWSAVAVEPRSTARTCIRKTYRGAFLPPTTPDAGDEATTEP